MLVPSFRKFSQKLRFIEFCTYTEIFIKFSKTTCKTRSGDPGRCLFHSFMCGFHRYGYLSTLFSNGISLIAIIIDSTLIIITRKTTIVQIFEEKLYYNN